MRKDKKSTILVVDDTPENIDVLVGILKERYKVKIAQNGKEALKLATKKPPELILLDIMMPEMDGYEACQKLKSMEETKDVPIIFLSAKTEMEDIVKGFELGAVDYVTKPFNPTELLARVNTHLTIQQQRVQIEESYTQLEEKNNFILDSIRFASLIQQALLPKKEVIDSVIDDYFVIWEPKDIVGGDIYFFDKINDCESLLYIIDCTGHGVPGAIMTTLVKAIQRNIMATITKEKEISPAGLLKMFNRDIKRALRQNQATTDSNAGFDGAIVHFNKTKNQIKYAGASVPLFFVRDDLVNRTKGDRHSIGYRNSDENFNFTDHEFNVAPGDLIYISTDGFLDQNGGDKGFSYGHKNFSTLLEKISQKPMSEQKTILLKTLKEYQGEHEKTDDITLFAVRF
jgi:CheY-like chemotaxis protein